MATTYLLMWRLLLAIAMLLIIPGIVLGLTLAIDAGALNEPQAISAAVSACTADLFGCSSANQIRLVQLGAIVVGAVSMALPLGMVLAGLVVGTNRTLMALVFSPITAISLIALGFIILSQALLSVAGAYFISLEVGGFGLAYKLVAGFAIGSVIAAAVLFRSLFGMFRPVTLNAVGEVATRESAPALYAIVEQLADKVGARPPEAIILGMEPTFYVTAAPVRVVGSGEIINGQSLFLSVPLMRVLTEREFAAVLGHELGHFRGGDTVYSRRFGPAFVGLQHAVAGIGGDGNSEEGVHLLAIPAAVLLSVLYEVFSLKEAKVSRVRELEADKVGASCSSPEALVASLVKLHLSSEQWHGVSHENFARLTRLQIDPNLGASFVARLRSYAGSSAMGDALAEIPKARTMHPIDSHPPIGERIEALGVAHDFVSTLELVPGSSGSAAEMIDGVDELEQRLTRLEHQVTVSFASGAIGYGERQYTKQRASQLLTMHMFAADGMRPGQAADATAAIGEEVLGRFDRAEFDRLVAGGEPVADFQTLLSLVGAMMSWEDKLAIRRYLRTVLEEVLASREAPAQLLKQLESEWTAL